MRFSRHARNEMRLYRLTREDVEAAVASARDRDVGERGNARLVDRALDGRRILVVVAEDDDQDFVIYPALGITEPVAAVVDRYGLDDEAIAAAAQSALAAPDRAVSVEVAARTVA